MTWPTWATWGWPLSSCVSSWFIIVPLSSCVSSSFVGSQSTMSCACTFCADSARCCPWPPTLKASKALERKNEPSRGGLGVKSNSFATVFCFTCLFVHLAVLRERYTEMTSCNCLTNRIDKRGLSTRQGSFSMKTGHETRAASNAWKRAFTKAQVPAPCTDLPCRLEDESTKQTKQTADQNSPNSRPRPISDPICVWVAPGCTKNAPKMNRRSFPPGPPFRVWSSPGATHSHRLFPRGSFPNEKRMTGRPFNRQLVTNLECVSAAFRSFGNLKGFKNKDHVSLITCVFDANLHKVQTL